MATYTDQIERLYVAYFGRPADPTGMAYWETVIESAVAAGQAADAVLQSVANTFGSSAEYTATYAGLNTNGIINMVYQNLFSHAPDPSGLLYWAQKLASGALTLGQIVDAISTSAINAGNTDGAAFLAKVSAATLFTSAVDTTDEILGYSGAAAGDLAKAFLSGIYDASTLATATTTVALNNTILNIVNSGTASYTLTPSAQSVAEGSSASFTLTTTGVANGTVLSYAFSGAGVTAGDIASGLGGTVTVQNNQATINLAANSDGLAESTETVTVTLSHNGKADTLATAKINITNVNVNTAPVFATSSATVSVAENSDLNYSASATDGQGDAITYSLAGTNATAFTINASTGALHFVSLPNYESGVTSYSVILKASDNATPSLTGQQALTINVSNVNEAPRFGTSNVNTSIDENSISQIENPGGVASDPDAGDHVHYSLSGPDAALFAVTTGGSLSFHLGANFELPRSTAGTNTYSVNLVAKDDGGLSATQVLKITVNNVNEGPSFDVPTVNYDINENSADPINPAYAVALDPDNNDLLTYSLAGPDAAAFTVDANGQMRFATPADFETPGSILGGNVYAVFLVATDRGGLTASQIVVVTVLNTADTLTFANTSSVVNVNENSNPTLNPGTRGLLGEGSDGVITFSLGGADAAAFTVDPTGAIHFAAAPDFETPGSTLNSNTYHLTLLAQSGEQHASQAVTVNVADVNDAPYFALPARTLSVNENTTAVNLGLSVAQDADAGDGLVYTLTGADAARFAVNAAGAVSFINAPDFETPSSSNSSNTYLVNLVATDHGALSATQALTVNVVNVNEAPTFNLPSRSLSFNENSNDIVNLPNAGTQDVDAGDTLSYSLAGPDAGAFTVDANGNLRFVAQPNFEAPGSSLASNAYALNLIVTDHDGLQASQDLNITVNNVNEAPSFTDPVRTISYNENAISAVNGATPGVVDPDAGESLTYQLTGADAAKFAVDANGIVHFVNAPNFEAPGSTSNSNSYAVNLTVTDHGGLHATQALTVNVVNVNEAPVLPPSQTLLAYQYSMNYSTLLALDPDGDPVTFSLVGADGGALHGDVVIVNPATGLYSYDHVGAPVEHGSDTITFIATDNHGLASVAGVVAVTLVGVI